MPRSSWALTIAGLSIILHVCLTIYVAYGLTEIDQATLNNKYGLVQSFLIIYLILEISMLIASILLVIGVKKGMHQYIPIWIFLSLLCTVSLCIVLIWNGNRFDLAFAFKIIMIVVQVGMLYPVFALWYNMRSKRHLQQQMSMQSTAGQPLNSGFCNEVYPTFDSTSQPHQDNVNYSKQQFV